MLELCMTHGELTNQKKTGVNIKVTSATQAAAAFAFLTGAHWVSSGPAGRSGQSGDGGHSAKDKGEIGEIYGIEDTPKVVKIH